MLSDAYTCLKIMSNSSLCPLVAELKIESPLWMLMANYSNCQNLYLSSKYIGHGFLVYFATFHEAS